jgi:HK97 family phage major capsid protein
MADVASLIEQLQAIIAEMETLQQEAEAPDEATEEKMTELETEAKSLQKQIDRAERFTANLASLKASLPRSAPAVEKTEERAIAVAPTPEPVHTEVRQVSSRVFAIPRATHALRAFKGPNAEEAAYRSGMWIRGYLMNDREARRWCADHGVLTRADDCNLPAQAGRVQGVDAEDPSLGGALVPDEMANTIIRLVEEYGVYPREASNVKMNSDVLLIPRRLSGLTAVPVNENCAPAPETMTFDQVKLIATQWAVQNRVPNSLLEDSVINLADLIAQEAGYGFAVAIDEAGFNGDGTAAANYTTGVNTALTDGTHSASVYSATGTTFPDLTMEDFVGAMSLLPDYAVAGAKWFISPSGYGQSMVPIAMAAGGNTTQEVADGPNTAAFLGFPVVMCNAMPSGSGDQSGNVACLFGNFNQACTYGDRRAIQIKTSQDRFMEYDQLLTYASARNSMVAHELGDDSKPGSLIALQFSGGGSGG